MREHENEPVVGLPERLPGAERIIWQGKPDTRALASNTLRFRWLVAYFAVMVSWTVVVAVADHTDFGVAALAILRAAGLAAAGLGLVRAFAWATARSTVYTVTDRRVVIRFGLALPMTVNLPFAQVEGIAVKAYPDGHADIVIEPTAGQRIAYFVMWPHTRPWRLKKAQPMLLSVPEGARVARLLGQAFAGSAGLMMESAPGRASRPETAGVRPVAA